MIAAVFAYLSATAATVMAVLSHRQRRTMQRVTAQLAERLEEHARDRAFTHWARWTVLTVVTSDGAIEATTLKELWDRGTRDRVWSDPISVSLWHADPDVLDRFRQDLEGGTRG